MSLFEMTVVLSIVSIVSLGALNSAKALKDSTDRSRLLQRLELSIQHASKMSQILQKTTVLRADPIAQTLSYGEKPLVHFNGRLQVARFGNVGKQGAESILFYRSGRNSAGSIQLRNPNCRIVISSLGALRAQC